MKAVSELRSPLRGMRLFFDRFRRLAEGTDGRAEHPDDREEAADRADNERRSQPERRAKGATRQRSDR
jgi:hypothetical protein